MTHERWSCELMHWRWYGEPTFWARVDEMEAICRRRDARHAYSKNAKRRVQR